jgi:hypothetical protein
VLHVSEKAVRVGVKVIRAGELSLEGSVESVGSGVVS